MMRIKNGRLTPLIVELLSTRARFEIDSIKQVFPIEFDDDPVNQQMRKNLFLQQRDILLKLAESRERGQLTYEGTYPRQTVSNEIYKLSWNLSRDFNLEAIPTEIVRCLKYAKLLEKSPELVFPKFSTFYREEMVVTMEMTTLPI
jgi:hypothetical protein